MTSKNKNIGIWKFSLHIQEIIKTLLSNYPQQFSGMVPEEECPKSLQILFYMKTLVTT